MTARPCRGTYPTLFTRLMANTAEPENEQACWSWIGKRDRWAYGRLNVYVPGLARVVTVMAHIAAWVCVHSAPASANEFWLAYAELQASGLELDHVCMMPPCLNVDHLEPVTPSENCKRRDARKNERISFAQCFSV